MLKYHFLNVGKGNCTIIEFPSGRLSMIDIDNSKINNETDSLTDPLKYFGDKFGNKNLFRFILTHPDMDHLSGLNELAKKYIIYNFWDTNNDKKFAESDWEDSIYDKRDWDRYLEFKESDESPKCLTILRGAIADCCWTQDNIKILSPSSSLVKLANESGDYHHLSYVLMTEHSGFKVLFGGDASIEAWDDILEKLGPESLKANIFVAPHHGSKNNVHKEAFKAVDPDYVIVSVMEGKDYDYDTYKNLAKKEVLSTKYYGTIRFEINDDGKISKIFVERNADK
jgi:competence protein ComEC